MKNNTLKQTEIGEIPEDWEIGKLKDYVLIKGRIGWRGLKKSEYVNEGYAIINGQQLFNDRILWDEVGRITEERYLESPEIMLQDEDIVMTKDGTLGKTAFIPKLKEPTSVASGIFVIRNQSDSLDQRYLYQYFKSPVFKSLINSRIEGAVIPHLFQKDINELLVPIPTIIEQQQIASILTSLDGKIELNRRMNKTLEEIGKALFKQWFVDFEFPNENGKPYKSSGGEMVESELGEIPEGWKVCKIDEIADFQNGFAFYTIGYSESGLKVVDLLNIDEQGNFKESVRDKHLSKENAKKGKFSKYLLEKDDLVMVMTDMTQSMGILGKCARIRESNKFILNQRICRFRAKSVDTLFLQTYLNSEIINNKLKQVSLGTVQKYFNTSHIKELDFVIPSKNIMDKYSHIIKPIYNEKEGNLKEMDLLEQLRDSLLPRLMSGRIRV